MEQSQFEYNHVRRHVQEVILKHKLVIPKHVIHIHGIFDHGGYVTRLRHGQHGQGGQGVVLVVDEELKAEAVHVQILVEVKLDQWRVYVQMVQQLQMHFVQLQNQQHLRHVQVHVVEVQ